MFDRLSYWPEFKVSHFPTATRPTGLIDWVDNLLSPVEPVFDAASVAAAGRNTRGVVETATQVLRAGFSATIKWRIAASKSLAVRL